MRQLMKCLAEFIGHVFSLIYSPIISKSVRAFVSHMYTGYWSTKFACWGEKSIMGYKASALEGLRYIHIGNNVELDRGIRLTAWDNYQGEKRTPEIIIGENCHIGAMSHITACNGIVIGKNLLTGTNVIITDNAHGRSDVSEMNIHPEKRSLVSKGKVIIGDNVWLGNNVCIMPNVTIGDGVIVGANSVVTKDIPSYSVAAGAPARVVKQIRK